MNTPKEDAYDAQIAPLMGQIIDICRENNIAHVASFALDDNENGTTLCCTSCNVDEDRKPPEKYKRCVDLLYRPEAAKDGSKTVTAILP